MDSRRRFIFSVFLLTVVSAAAADPTGFDGKWVLDKNKTQATGGPEDLQLEIKQQPNKVVIKSKYKEPKDAIYPLLWVGIMTYELELPTDGTERVTQIGPFAHNSKTKIEGSKMITDFVASNDTGKVDGQWIRTLSGDGKEMTLQIVTAASDGRKLDQTLFFKRK
ncbi:MAG TPA: hypothetical protein VEX68_22015 [Bryobacteraceae bacterium]|nr:hypothetical protein [Bryobacteraceae bacterium]